MRARGLALYFALAFAISWGAVLVASRLDGRAWMFGAMVLGPSVASLALTAAGEGAHGLRDLARRMLRWRIGARWYAALLVAPAVLVVALVGAGPGLQLGPPALLAVGIVAGIFEELGWTGFATPRLLRRFGWFDAGLLLGVPWAVWHALPDYLSTHAAYGSLWLPHMLEWYVALVAFRVLMTWIYSRTQSLGLAMLLHASFTGSQLVLWPAVAPAAELIWYGVFATLLWVAVTIVVLATTRFVSIAASAREKRRAMPGDRIVVAPWFAVTHAITIDTVPDGVWPWLAQMGADRAGWYSYDRIDNRGRPSAQRIVDELQAVRPGDIMPALPGATEAFVVAGARPPRDLVLAVPGERGTIASWEHLVEPVGDGQSRLIVRGRVASSWKRMARDASHATAIERLYRVLGRMPDALLIPVAALGHRWMEARHLRGIKRRAEASTRSP